MNIYRLNDYEWWAATDMESAIEAATHETGLSDEEVADEDARQLNQTELDNLTYYWQESESPDTPEEGISFREALRRKLEAGYGLNGAAFLFASTEY